jgi:hypothetical protein
MKHLKLGRRPSRRLVKLRLSDYVDVSYLLKRIPDKNNFGHYAQVPAGRSYLNDTLGCCVIAGAQHEHDMMASVTGRSTDLFDDASTVKNYEAIGGYNPADPSTDGGCDMEAAASYRRKTGIVDRFGKTHKISAYVRLDPGNLDQLRVAMWLFPVGGGMHFYDYMQDEFDKGKPWNWNARGKDEGGHYVACLGMKAGNVICETWGKTQPITQKCYTHAFDEILAYYSPEMLLASGKSAEGFDEKALLADLTAVTKLKAA